MPIWWVPLAAKCSVADQCLKLFALSVACVVYFRRAVADLPSLMYAPLAPLVVMCAAVLFWTASIVVSALKGSKESERLSTRISSSMWRSPRLTRTDERGAWSSTVS